MFYSEYTKRVLPFMFLAIVLLSCILALALRNKSERVRAIPTAIVAIILIFIEIVKQRWAFSSEYDMFYAPIHYCSLFLLFIPLAELFGKRLSHIFRPIAMCMAFVVSAGMYIYPNGILTQPELFGTEFYSTHTFIFHHLIVLYFVLVVALRLCRPRVRDAVMVGVIGVVYISIAIPAANAFQTNYCNFLESVIPLMENIRIEKGQDIYIALISIFLTLGTTRASLLLVATYKLFVRNKIKNDG